MRHSFRLRRKLTTGKTNMQVDGRSEEQTDSLACAHSVRLGPSLPPPTRLLAAVRERESVA